MEVLHHPSPVLRSRAAVVDVEADVELRDLIRAMAETMYDAPGVGLAAPQVGVSRRLVVIDCAPKSEPPQLLTCFNPELVAREGESCQEEGCLSVPGYFTSLTRSARVTVRFLDLQGEPVQMEAEGLLAVAFQHEIDHLDGILFVDRLSPLKKGIFRKKYPKILEELM